MWLYLNAIWHQQLEYAAKKSDFNIFVIAKSSVLLDAILELHLASAKGLSIAACINCHRSPQCIAGPEIYSSDDFANDRIIIIPYNYNHDPLAEYLKYR